MSAASPALLQAQGLCKSYGYAGGARSVVKEASFTVYEGQTLGIVGASGSGKSTLAKLVVGLERADAGALLWQGETLPPQRSAMHSRLMSMVFQNPVASLNPRMHVGAIVGEPLTLQRVTTTKQNHRERVQQALADVGLTEAIALRYPHELSGGQQQRVAIARALCTQPKLLVADEPLSALDVSVGAQIANLLMDLQQRHGLAYVFISHDLHMVAHLSHQVMTMRDGVLSCT
ncbi:MAG: dipeptide/oligopeptide/nickel ABC transporter ATP-binding protein [Deltaproteobacteria bacterium]|nr:dipeptide/oligopeptide/nickel ABC transporter ATP-binding protein [Deltaproteobacteria bacterium]